MSRLLLGVAAALVVGFAVWAALPSAPQVGTVGAGVGSGGAPVARGPVAAAPVAAAPAAAAPLPAPVAEKDLAARIDACLATQREVAGRRAARGGPTPPGEPTDAAVVSRACAPLYREPACRDAMMRFDTPPPEARSATVLQTCALAYCPQLPAPKPAACANPGTVPDDQWSAWSELRLAILTKDIGADAARRVTAPVR